MALLGCGRWRGIYFPGRCRSWTCAPLAHWYHLREHLWAAAKVVHGEGKPETKTRAEQWKTEVTPEAHKSGSAVRKWWRSICASSWRRVKTIPITPCANAPISCGPISTGFATTSSAPRAGQWVREWWKAPASTLSACALGASGAFKRQSTRWTKEGARAVLHLRLERMNGRWDQRCDLVRRAA
jgi:hypothetical protein